MKLNKRMNILKKIRSVFKIFSLNRDQAIYNCLENDIPLTDENIVHVIEILDTKRKNGVNRKSNKKE